MLRLRRLPCLAARFHARTFVNCCKCSPHQVFTVGNMTGSVVGRGSAADGKAKSKASAIEAPQRIAGAPPPPPTGVPLPFTIADVRAAIPAHCFERSALKSGAYLVRDLAVVATAAAAIQFVSRLESLPGAILAAAWLVYWVITGMTLTGVWVIAHEVRRARRLPDGARRGRW